MSFTYLALFSLILAYALPFAMDNIHNYKESNRLRDDLHDTIKNDIDNIGSSSAAALTLLGKDNPGVEDRLRLITAIAREISHNIRGFLSVIGTDIKTWTDLCAYLRENSYKLLQGSGIEFEFTHPHTIKDLKPPSILLKDSLCKILKEAITNVKKHSHADKVEVWLSFTNNNDQVTLEIKDNGIGFDKERIDKYGHYGLSTMKKRAERSGGVFIIETAHHQKGGTYIKISMPLR